MRNQGTGPWAVSGAAQGARAGRRGLGGCAALTLFLTLLGCFPRARWSSAPGPITSVSLALSHTCAAAWLLSGKPHLPAEVGLEPRPAPCG